MLNPKELNYLQNRDFLATKVIIQEKITTLLGITQKALKNQISATSFEFPSGIDLQAGKISRGERYQNLPYWVLDYPKLFTSKDTFALRTMVWWGHEITCTLHLQGNSWTKYRQQLLVNLQNHTSPSLLVCLHPHPWTYSITDDNYLASEQIYSSKDLIRQLHQQDFFKMTQVMHLTEIEELPTFASICLEEYLKLL